MGDYRLEELGPRAFEQMAVSLAATVFGADIQVYGSGRDRGREATWTGTFMGHLRWPGASDTVWTGYTVIQAKHKEWDHQPAQNLQWLKGQIAAELNGWIERSDRDEPLPRNLLFITNARLSAELGVDEISVFIHGQLDKVRTPSEQRGTLRKRGMVQCAVWHRDTVRTLLDDKAAVRAAYPVLLTAGDILTKIKLLPGDIEARDLGPALLGHALSAFSNERWVRFSEASETNQKQSIERVIIDLPTTDMEGVNSSAILDCLSRGNRNLRRSQWRADTPRHVVLTGAPGNGKSTISSFVAQAYRSLFLEPDATRVEDQITRGLRQALERIQVQPPLVARWPMRLDLADMAFQMGPSGGPNLMRYLCERISERCDIKLQPVALGRWLKGWPSTVVFDGLDEVTAPELRARVLEEIEEFVQRADREDWDLFTIITTRPTGYTERFMPDDFEQIDLALLEPAEAILYAEHVTYLRLADDTQHAAGILSRFREAARDDAISRLIRTPLQILMMTFILEHGAAVSTNRYQLFWDYYLAVFKREAGKTTSLRTFFQEYEEVITDLHARAGLILQVACESSGETRPKLPRTELAVIARERLVDIGLHAEVALTNAVKKLLDIAHTRLILLVADEGETVSYEVRSLQEVMAARALTDGSDEQIASNLRVTAPSPHWRNVWLLTAGRLFEESDHRRNLVLEVVEALDNRGDGLGALYPVAPSLAADVIQDDLAASRPRWLRRLAAVVATAFDGPMPDDPHLIAQALGRAATQDMEAEHQIREAMKTALQPGHQGIQIAAVIAAYRTLGPIPGELSPQAGRKLLTAWLEYTPGASPSTSAADIVLEKLYGLAGQELDSAESMVRDALGECSHLRAVRTQEGWLVPLHPWSEHKPSPILRVVADSADAQEVMRLCLDGRGAEEWLASSLIGHSFYLENFRRPVGPLLNLPYRAIRSSR